MALAPMRRIQSEIEPLIRLPVAMRIENASTSISKLIILRPRRILKVAASCL